MALIDRVYDLEKDVVQLQEQIKTMKQDIIVLEETQKVSSNQTQEIKITLAEGQASIKTIVGFGAFVFAIIQIVGILVTIAYAKH